ncbi:MULTISPECIES: 3-hydroxyacyl-CoA dehydrogenase family protein [unclassified Aeromicrobium]|uniref:3-hydroxyacyl-CoA dehydrogenase family protein n=1 Tax=unclassified Aeromicrobium TaxID=2633570 RepID=UPI00396B3F9B
MSEHMFRSVVVVGGTALARVIGEQLTVPGVDVAVVEVVDSGRLTGVDLVIEAVSQRDGAKAEALAAVTAAVGPDVVVATTTTGGSVTELAADLPSPGRVIGLVWHHAVAGARTVEVIRGRQSTASVLERVTTLVELVPDKDVVVIDDRPGGLLHSLLMPYLNDVVQAYDEDLASAEDLDLALRLGLGYRVGPLELLDTIGLDEHLGATAAAHRSTADGRYAPPPLLARMVAAGELGAQAHHGFRTQEEN